MNYLQPFNIADDLENVWKDKTKAIQEFMPEIHRSVAQIAKRNSQTSMSLMTLNMIDMGPYRTLAQLTVQIDTKYNSLMQLSFRLRKKKIKLKELEDRYPNNALDIVEIEKINYELESSVATIKNIIKEIGALQQRYKEVIKNKGLPEDWSEEDFEKAEVEHHIKCIFRNAIRDRMAGNCNMGTMEYMEQFGIEPTAAYALVDNFLAVQYHHIKKSFDDNKVPDITDRYKFYDDMYHQFKNEYKKAMERIGLDSIHYADFLMKENR